MNEDFIHYLWKFKKLSGMPLHTTAGELVVIKNLGMHNHHAGPDFFNAQVHIGKQLWAGNVEMHLKSSDWYAHGHDDDPAYDNVILHVVWTHDAEISRRDEVHIPVLEVSNYIAKELIAGYQQLFAVKNNQFINCDNQLASVDGFRTMQWFEKLFIERLEQRALRIQVLLLQQQNNWEAVFFQLLCRSFGTKVNADAFENLSRSIEQQSLRKLAKDAFQLEATLLGQAGLLEESRQDLYYGQLVQEYAFVRAKYNLQPATIPMKFFRLRPTNYATVRLSQLAMLYHRNPQLFGEVLLAKTKEEICKLFDVQASRYWDNHHVFDKQTESRPKILTPDFIDLLIINCIVPLRFVHAQAMGKDLIEELLELMQSVSAEKNSIISGFKKMIPIKNALTSQAVLQLKPHYCDVNRCLHCDIGISLLQD
jgi:hypothetical protein